MKQLPSNVFMYLFKCMSADRLNMGWIFFLIILNLEYKIIVGFLNATSCYESKLALMVKAPWPRASHRPNFFKDFLIYFFYFRHKFQISDQHLVKWMVEIATGPCPTGLCPRKKKFETQFFPKWPQKNFSPNGSKAAEILDCLSMTE